MFPRSFIAVLVAALIVCLSSPVSAQQKLSTDSFNDTKTQTGPVDSFNDKQTPPAAPAAIPGGPQGPTGPAGPQGETKVATATSSSSASSAVTVSTVNAPAWETREGIEQAARHYFESKQTYIVCRGRGDGAGMRRAEASMARFSSQLAEFKKQQAARDKAQDKRLDKHSELVWKHETQLNGKEGLVAKVGTLQKEMNEIVTPAIAGIDDKFDGLTWWVLALTLCVIALTLVAIVGFSRRFWIHR